MRGIEVTSKDKKANMPFTVAAIGASAGGLDAAIELFKNLPENIGMCFIYIQHMPPDHESKLPEILARITKMPVEEAKNNTRLKPGNVYVIPANRDLEIEDGTLKLTNRPLRSQAHLPINQFFISLANQYKEKAIGILLSGNPPDGTLGLKAIKAAGGITFAQDQSAKFQGMALNAISVEAVDLVLSPQAIAEELVKLLQHQQLYNSSVLSQDEELIQERDENLVNIIRMIHRLTGVDFSHYKVSTIRRRIIRRMILNKIDELSAYVTYLKQNGSELQQLYKDLLINVTNFFRDAEAADFLKKELLPKLIKSKQPEESIRIWVPACSTGQEAYSLIMLLMEVLGEKAIARSVNMFATDLSEVAINKARLGIYTSDEVADVSPKRLQRFFTKVDGSYRINKDIRELCVFATHNVLKDPPFSRLDLISCCNLLIYLEPVLQKKLIGIFHYTLNSNGYLILGESETVGNSAYLFSQVDKKHKIYAKKKDATANAIFQLSFHGSEKGKTEALQPKNALVKLQSNDIDLDKAVETALLKKYTPACVVVNADLDIMQFRGTTGLFLEPAPGKASLNLLKMARQNLNFELRSLVYKAIRSGVPEIKTWDDTAGEGKTRRVTIECLPLKPASENQNTYYLVIFDEQLLENNETTASGVQKEERVKQLENELNQMREDMRSMVESLEAANQELQTVNEEIVSSNEELQSINEEMETSKEELESSNEELITINQELQMRNEQLAEVQEYSEAVFTTIREAVLVLDKNLRIKNANSCFYKTFKVTEEETEGKLLYNLGNEQWNIPRLKELLEEIIPRNAHVNDFEVTHTFPGIGEKVMLLNARRLVRKLHSEHLILLAIEDITQFKRVEKLLEEREQWYRNLADNSPMMIWVIDLQKKYTFVNATWLAYRNMRFEEAIGKHFVEAHIHPDDKETCHAIIDKSFVTKMPFSMQYRLKIGKGYITLLSKGKPNFGDDGSFLGFLGSCVEISQVTTQAGVAV